MQTSSENYKNIKAQTDEIELRTQGEIAIDNEILKLDLNKPSHRRHATRLIEEYNAKNDEYCGDFKDVLGFTQQTRNKSKYKNRQDSLLTSKTLFNYTKAIALIFAIIIFFIVFILSSEDFVRAFKNMLI